MLPGGGEVSIRRAGLLLPHASGLRRLSVRVTDGTEN